MKLFISVVLGIVVLALVNAGLWLVAGIFGGLPFAEHYSWVLHPGISLLLIFYFFKCLEEAEEKGREVALMEAKQEEKKEDFDDDISTGFPMFTDKASPREDKFGTIDLVFRSATGAEAAIMAIQFIDHEIFQGAWPAHRGPSSFGRAVNEAAVRVIYRRVNDSYLASSDAEEQRESIEEAYEEMRLKLPDGRVWKITDSKNIIWLPYNKFMYDMIILLDPVVGEPRKYHP